MTLHQLKIFATAAKLGNFTQAAEFLHIRQPSVSLLVQGLERELEIKMFEKLGNKVRLTAAGEILLRDAEEILSRVERIKEEMDEVKGLKRGRLSIGGSAIAGATFLPEALQMFRKNYPDVAVALRIERSSVLEESLLRRDLDVAVLSHAPQSPLLRAELYRHEEIVGIASPRHPVSRNRFVRLESLAKESLIVHERGTSVRDMLERAFARKKLRLVPWLEIVLQVGTIPAIKKAVMSGLGVGFLAKCHVLSDIEMGKLKLLKIPGLHLKRRLHIVTHRNLGRSPLCQAFIDFLKRHRA